MSRALAVKGRHAVKPGSSTAGQYSGARERRMDQGTFFGSLMGAATRCCGSTGKVRTTGWDGHQGKLDPGWLAARDNSTSERQTSTRGVMHALCGPEQCPGRSRGASSGNEGMRGVPECLSMRPLLVVAGSSGLVMSLWFFLCGFFSASIFRRFCAQSAARPAAF